MWICYCDRCGTRLRRPFNDQRGLRMEFTDFSGELGEGKGNTFLFTFCQKCLDEVMGPLKSDFLKAREREKPDAI